MKEYDKIYPITEGNTIRKNPVPMENVIECFRFGKDRIFYHFLERNATGGADHVYVVNYQPVNNISTEVITEEDFKIARFQMALASVEPDLEKEFYQRLKKLREEHPELFHL